MNQHPNSASVSSQPPADTIDAQTQLNQTRRELREFLMGDSVPAKTNRNGTVSHAVAAATHLADQPARARKPNNNVNTIDWMGLVKAAASTWWRDHPLHVGTAVLTPVVTDYVKRKPAATLAVAAAAGAALVLIRPWRIASVTALGMGLIRSSNLPVIAASLVATVAENLQKEQS